jgi:hypothetical protein
MDELIELLNRSLDGDLTPAERERLIDALNRFPWLAAEKKASESLRQNVAALRPSSFGPHFSLGVMAALNERETLQARFEKNFRALRSAFYRVGLAGAVACLLFAAWSRIVPADPDADMQLDLDGAVEIAVYSPLEESL